MYVIKYVLLFNVFCTSTVIGILLSKKYANRVNTLTDFMNALSIFEVKIRFSFETIPEIFNEISAKMNGVVGNVFKDTVDNINENNMIAGDAWNLSVDSNCSELKKEDKECIKTLRKITWKYRHRWSNKPNRAS